MTQKLFRIPSVNTVDASQFHERTSNMKHRFETLEAAAASNPRIEHLCAQAMNQARSLGVILDPTKEIDAYQLSADLKAAGIASPEATWRLKTCLAQIGVL
jgi:hypothetical protein